MMLKHAPYRDVPVSTSAVEMVMDDEPVDDKGVFLGDDPEMLSDFDDNETDEFLLPHSESSPPKVLSESSQRAKGRILSQPAPPPSSSSTPGTGSTQKWGSMTCSYCLNILYVPAMFGM